MEVSKQALQNIISDEERLLFAENIPAEYLSDALGRRTGTADALVFALSTEDVSGVPRYANENGIPVTPRGAGTNLVGSTIPLFGGIILDVSRMNRVLELDRDTMTITAVATGTGVGINALLSRNLGEKNFVMANRTAGNAIFLGLVSYGVFALLGVFGSRLYFTAQVEDPEIIALGCDYLSIILVLSIGCFGQVLLSRLLQSTGKTFYSMVIQMVGAGLNIVLDPIMIFGLFGFTFFCVMLRLGTSILAGCLTMSICILPTIVRTTEESLLAVPESYKEGALALGAGKLRVILSIVLPCAMPGILTAVILGMGRLVGESAALMFTSGMAYEMPQEVLGHVMDAGRTLTLHLYQVSKQAVDPNAFNIAYATASVLLILVFVLNRLAGLLSRVLKKG